MRNIDYYNPNLKAIFTAKLNWNNTIEVKLIKTPKKGKELNLFSYIAGGINRLYMKRDYKAYHSYIIIFTLKKTDNIMSAKDACKIVSDSIKILDFK